MRALVTLAVLTTTLGVSGLSFFNTAAAQSPNANQEHTTQRNVWEFLYYVDDDNNPNTPPARSTLGPNFSRQECNERRDAILAQGVVLIGTQYYPIESVDKCQIIKSPTQETEKLCFTFKEISSSETLIDCYNTKQFCNFARQGFIDFIERTGGNYEDISQQCEQKKHLT
jgi:hypothetical protein